MSIKGLENINIASQEILPSPRELKLKLPISEEAKNNIGEFRETIGRILKRKDDRLLVIVGPCSIHDFEAAKEYADKLKKLADELKENIYIVMRVYFEKPRTTVGWKGFINDPYLDDSFKIGDGLLKARELLIHLADIGLPAGTEALDPITPQYLGDLVSWTAIG
ncbi:MAG: 3-deoxy-7-phosphoheptulonate synthase, partial [Gammaproteobacteria bacterium]